MQNDRADVADLLKTFISFLGAEFFQLSRLDSGFPNAVIGAKAGRAVLQSWSFNVVERNLGFLCYQGFPPVENRTWRGDSGT